MTRYSLLAIPAALACAAAAAAAAGPPWLPIGPAGGEVTTAAFAPSAPEIVFAGTANAGMFRSADGGQSWAPAGAGIPLPRITALVVASSDPDTVYAGAMTGGPKVQGGIFLTRDGGASWRSTTPAPVVLTFGFAVDPHDPTLIYAATSAGLLRTRIGEPTWSRIFQPVLFVASVAVDPLRSSTLYAGVYDSSGSGGVYKSTDSGRSWSRSGGAGPDVFANAGGAFNLVFDPTTKDTLYAVSGSSYGEIYRTRDGGRSWSHVVHPPALGLVSALAIGPSGTLYATGPGTSPAIIHSSDHGSTWSLPAGGGPADFIALQAVSPGATAGAPETLIAAGELGIWRSEDGARTWHPASHGLIAHQVSSLLASPDTLHLLVDSSSVGRGLFHSQDHGRHWQRTPDHGSQPNGLLAVDPQQPLTLYGGGLPLAKSIDGGLTWTPLSYPTDFADVVVAVVVDPTRSDTVYVDAMPQSVAGEHCEIGKSTDGGHTWTCFTATGEGFLALAIDPRQPDVLYGAGSLGVWRSVDGGATWASASQGLPADGATAMALDRTPPAEPAKLYAATAAGLFASVDGAATWHLLGAALPGGATRLVVDPRAPDHLYAGIPDAGVFHSADGGSTWSQLRRGLPAPLFSGVFELDPVLPATLYAGTDGKGVFRIDLVH